MLHRQKTRTEPFWANTWGSLKRSGVFAGSVTSIGIITIGRTFFDVASTTISGWSALFFLALFLGISVANLCSNTPFAGILQTLGFITGSLTSLGALFSLEYDESTVSDILLGISCVLLIPCLLGLRPRDPAIDHDIDRTLVDWTLRLDDLMKYELPPALRPKLADLMDTLWQSPPNQANFIPAQNRLFQRLLSDLEISIKSGFATAALETADELSCCLHERNHLLNEQIEIDYRDVTEHKVLPNKPVLTTIKDQSQKQKIC